LEGEMNVRVRPLLLLLPIAVIVVFALCSCCMSDPVTWIPDGAPQTMGQVERNAQNVDASPAQKISPEDAPDARYDVLVWLRQRGADGERAATLLTQGFPARTAAVPVRIEIAQVDGVRSLIVVESAGGSSGARRYRRLWVFEMDSGQLVRSASFP
jgi:hypothetical protein